MKTILAMLFSTATLLAAAQDTSVIKMENFIDTDPGVGNATSVNIPSASDVTFPFNVDVSSYSIGYHKLYIRTRDNLGKWSFTARRSIEIISSETNNDVINGEYFIDTDPGFGYGMPIIVPQLMQPLCKTLQIPLQPLQRAVINCTEGSEMHRAIGAKPSGEILK